MAVARKQAVALLEEIALLLELKGENPFKIRAYTNGARALGTLDGDFEALVRSGDLAKVKGFGKALVEKLAEFVETGELGYLNDLRSEFPETLGELMRLNGVGPKKVKLFYEDLGIATVAELEDACKDGRVAALPGCGQKTADKIVAAIARSREHDGLFHYEQARAAADRVMDTLAALPQVQRIELAGSLRRFKEVTKDVDILASAADPGPVMAAFAAMPEIQTMLAQGETKSSAIFRNGIQCDLRIVDDEIFANALHHFTGSKDHNVAIRGRAIELGMKVSEWGLFAERGEGERIPCADEAALFKHLGLSMIPPELRENLGEIEAAEHGELPAQLVTEDDYRGVLHCHSHASDGSDSIEALAAHAIEAGHAYLGITDHSVSSFQANGLSAERLLAQVEQVRAVQESVGDSLTLFAGVECDIKTDGSLDYEDDVLAALDYFVISVHNAFSRPEPEMTARVIRAMEHPGAKILAHPTGRLLLRRDAYAIDLDKIIDAAAANGVAIELNCNPFRMDMDWRHWHKARDRGVACSLNPDAHALVQFDYVRNGIGFCRKGWLTADDVLNCWPTERVRDFFAAT
jgi:DNA polymerase (family 10)